MGLERHAEHPFLQLLASAAFINQLIGGVVQMDIQFRNRIMLFLFGGEDARIDPTEELIMQVWFAELAQSINHRAFGHLAPSQSAFGSFSFQTDDHTPSDRDHSVTCFEDSKPRFLELLQAWIRWQVAIVGFDHIDLQKMVLLEGRNLHEHRDDILNRLSVSSLSKKK